MLLQSEVSSVNYNIQNRSQDCYNTPEIALSHLVKRHAVSHSRKQSFAKPHLLIETQQWMLLLLHRISFHFIYEFDMTDIEKKSMHSHDFIYSGMEGCFQGHCNQKMLMGYTLYHSILIPATSWFKTDSKNSQESELTYVFSSRKMFTTFLSLWSTHQHTLFSFWELGREILFLLHLVL